MTILTFFQVRCDPCERWLGCSRPAITNSSDSPHFLDFTSAYNEAVARGWSASPLICPDCAAEWREKVLDESQDGRAVRESGEGA